MQAAHSSSLDKSNAETAQRQQRYAQDLKDREATFKKWCDEASSEHKTAVTDSDNRYNTDIQKHRDMTHAQFD
jgi:hypothetical protein